jgi:hypothetical protein
MEFIKTKNEVYVIGRGQRVESNCFSICFINAVASNTVTINGVTLLAGEQYKVSQPTGCVDTTWYDMAFSAGAGVDQVTVSRIMPV